MDPEWGRSVKTAYDLFDHLIDLGQPELAMQVMNLQIQVEDDHDRD